MFLMKFKNVFTNWGVCGCGTPEEAYRAVYEMLKRAGQKEGVIKSDEGHVLFMAYTLDRIGYLDHDTSIYSSRLTGKGEKLLDALEVFKKYDFDMVRVTDEMNDDMWDAVYE